MGVIYIYISVAKTDLGTRACSPLCRLIAKADRERKFYSVPLEKIICLPHLYQWGWCELILTWENTLFYPQAHLQTWYPSLQDLLPQLHWTCSPPPLDLFPTSTGLAPQLHWTCSPHPLNLLPTSTGLTPQLHWTCTPPPLDLLPTSTELAPQLHWTYSPATLDIFPSYTGLAPHHH